jgi:2-keto-4-pentenoate hydratase/2-oxohepta-3-ene-1,7-dioic acid hydratase in catechol pathway
MRVLDVLFMRLKIEPFITEVHQKAKHPCPKCSKFYCPGYLYYDHIYHCGKTFECRQCARVFTCHKSYVKHERKCTGPDLDPQTNTPQQNNFNKSWQNKVRVVFNIIL